MLAQITGLDSGAVSCPVRPSCCSACDAHRLMTCNLPRDAYMHDNFLPVRLIKMHNVSSVGHGRRFDYFSMNAVLAMYTSMRINLTACAFSRSKCPPIGRALASELAMKSPQIMYCTV
jgi:hypothetical protein